MKALADPLFFALRGTMFVACWSAATAVLAADCSVALSYRSQTSASALCLTSGSYPNDNEIVEAAERWNDACDMGGTQPALNVGGCGSSDITVTVNRIQGISDLRTGTCGYYQASSSGANTGGEIGIFEYGKDPFTHEVYSCATSYPIDVLMHEIGHALGLADATDSSCISHVMGAPSGAYSPAIFPDDCAAVDELWETSYEESLQEQEQCNLTCPQICTGSPPTCDTSGDGSGGDTGCGNWYDCSPLILDLAGDGITSTTIEDGVDFDINGDGGLDRTAWTRPNSDDAFLFFDFNRNGSVDGGRELLGEVTILPDGRRAANGFEALAAFDHPSRSGDSDGVITPSDRVWGLLRLWVDVNHDGVAAASEIHTLSARGVWQLNLAFVTMTAVDDYGRDVAGNKHLLQGTYIHRGTPGSGQRLVPRAMHDVYLQYRSK